MADLRTVYMGVNLRNPLILGSSSLSSSVDSMKKAEDAGFGAVVLKSIFEEQILNRTEIDMEKAEDYLTMGDADIFLKEAAKNYYLDRYLELVRKAKESLDIPVFASINCTDEESWTDYAKVFASCGADGVELNCYPIASNPEESGEAIEKKYISVASKTRRIMGDMPLSMKLSWHFTSIPNIVSRLTAAGMDAVVLFNHFFRPDIDIEKLEIDSEHAIQPKGDYSETLRWVAMVSSEISADVCASTGIRDHETAIKMILAGAKAVQMTSVIYEKGYKFVPSVLNGMEDWMDRHGFGTIESFRSMLSQEKIENPGRWERAQFVRLQNS